LVNYINILPSSGVIKFNFRIMKNLNLILAVLILSFQITNSQISKKFSGNTDYVHAVTFSPGGKYIAGGGYDGNIRIWDIESGNLVNSFNINNKIFKLYFDGEAENIVAGTEPLIGVSTAIDSFVFVFDAFDGKRNESANIKSKSPNIFVPGYGNRLTTFVPELYLDSCRNIVNYNIENRMEGKCYKLFMDNYFFPSVKYKGNSFLGMIGSWDFNYPVTISDNGKFLAIYSLQKNEEVKNSGNYSGDTKNKITFRNSTGIILYVFDVENKKMIERTILLDDNLNQKNILLSNDGTYFCYSGKHYLNDVIKILDVRTDNEVRILSGHSREILCLAMHPGGNFIASGSRDNTVRIWDFNTGKEIKVLKEHCDNVNYLSFSPDGRYLASASDDNSIRIWDLSSLSKDIDIYALQYKLKTGLMKFINESKSEELRKTVNSEQEIKAIDEKYNQKYNELYNKTLEEYNKKYK
jgi:WD40 repeat protein